MDAACLRQTSIPGTSKLFGDFLYRYDRVQRFYEAGPRPALPPERRAEIVAALAEQNGPHPALDELAKDNAVAFVTGQQVGLFSGPAYTIYKALTAIRLAERSRRNGTPAVTVFWLASEDHDFAEVNHVWAFDSKHRPTQVVVGEAINGDRPVGGIEIGSWPIGELRQAMSDLPFCDEVVQLVERAYQPGGTMAGSFRALLEELLKPYGVLFLDPLHRSIRKLAAPLLAKALLAGPALTRALLERNKELEQAGYHAQVHVEQKTSPFFLLDGDRRVPLRRAGEDLIARDRRYSAEELAAEADHISPNALLRPVVQDYLLPTEAYIGGPAEIAYFAQSQVLYQRLLGYMPRIVSRCGFTILDSRTQKLMARYRVTLPDLFHGEEALREKMANALVPPDLEAKFATAHAHIVRELDTLCDEVKNFDPTLGASLGKSSAKMIYQLAKAQAKVARETMRRDQRAAQDADYLYNSLYPHKHLQERLYSILPFLAKHGLQFISDVYESVQTECPDHVLLSL